MTKALQSMDIRYFEPLPSLADRQLEKALKSKSTLRLVETSTIALSILGSVAFIAPFLVSNFVKLHRGVVWGVALGGPVGFSLLGSTLSSFAKKPRIRIANALIQKEVDAHRRRSLKAQALTPLCDVRGQEELRAFTAEALLEPRSIVDKRLCIGKSVLNGEQENYTTRDLQRVMDIYGVDTPSTHTILERTSSEVRSYAKRLHESLYAHLDLPSLPEKIDQSFLQKAQELKKEISGIFERLEQVEEGSDTSPLNRIILSAHHSASMYMKIQDMLLLFADMADLCSGSPGQQRALFDKNRASVKKKILKLDPSMRETLFKELYRYTRPLLETDQNETLLTYGRAVLYQLAQLETFLLGEDTPSFNINLRREDLIQRAAALVKEDDLKGKQLIETVQEALLVNAKETKADANLLAWVKSIEPRREVKNTPIKTQEEIITAQYHNLLQTLKVKSNELEELLSWVKEFLKDVPKECEVKWVKAARALSAAEEAIKTSRPALLDEGIEAPYSVKEYVLRSYLRKEIDPLLGQARRLRSNQTHFAREKLTLTAEGVKKLHSEYTLELERDFKRDCLKVFKRKFTLEEWQELAEKMRPHLEIYLKLPQKPTLQFFRTTFIERLIVKVYDDPKCQYLDRVPMEVLEEFIPKEHDVKFLKKYAALIGLQLEAIPTRLQILEHLTRLEVQNAQDLHHALVKFYGPGYSHFMQIFEKREPFVGIDPKLVDESSKFFTKQRRVRSLKALNESSRTLTDGRWTSSVILLAITAAAIATIVVKNRIANIVCSSALPVSMIALQIIQIRSAKRAQQLPRDRLALQYLEQGKLFSIDPRLKELDLANDYLRDVRLATVDTSGFDRSKLSIPKRLKIKAKPINPAFREANALAQKNKITFDWIEKNLEKDKEVLRILISLYLQPPQEPLKKLQDFRKSQLDPDYEVVASFYEIVLDEMHKEQKTKALALLEC